MAWGIQPPWETGGSSRNDKDYKDDDSYQDLLVRLHGIFDFALTSKVVQIKDSNDKFEVTGAKVLEGRGGLLIDFLDFYSSKTAPNCLLMKEIKGDKHKCDNNMERVHTDTIALLLELGFISPEHEEVTTEGVEPFNLFQNHFVGLRGYHREPGRFNGAFMDVGWGISTNFLDRQDKRFKFRGYLPFRAVSQAKIFGSIEVDSDLGQEPDEVKMIFGTSIDMNRLLEYMGVTVPIAP